MPIDDLPIVLDRSSEVPLAVQVADALRDAASTGVLRVGDRLSSTRELAIRLGVSRTVTASAYDQLLAEGWLAGRQGSGTFVTAAPAAGSSAVAPSSAGRPADGPPATSMIDLTVGRPCLHVLDKSAWRRAWRAAADRPPSALPSYQGLLEFRQAVVDHLLRHRGLVVSPEQVVATSGTTSGVAELSALLPERAVVAMEEPGYQRAAGAMRAAGLRVVPVPVDREGVRVDALPAGLAALYCSPAHQFPLGVRLSARRRVELVRRARQESFLVFEDDYDGELRYDVAPLPLLAALGPDVVVHLGTASKLLTPTLGVGWVVAPPELTRRLLAARSRAGTRPAPAGQLVFTAFAELGDLGRHLRRLRKELHERREVVLAACRAAGTPVWGDAAGAHVRVPLPSAEAERAVVAAARDAGVVVPALAEYHAGAPLQFGISVGYAEPSRADLATAVAVVAEAAAGWRGPVGH
jgi:GntR family transcriptional regulator/MocR family aminotransferase